jgi:hypothetical protein
MRSAVLWVRAPAVCLMGGMGVLGYARGYRKSRYDSVGRERLVTKRTGLALLNALAYANPLCMPVVLAKDITKWEIRSRADDANFDYDFEEYRNADREFFGIEDFTHMHQLEIACLEAGRCLARLLRVALLGGAAMSVVKCVVKKR